MFLNPDINDMHTETWQSDRLPEGLREDYVRLDERTLEDLTAQCAEFSRFLRYYDQKNVEDGDWHEFFAPIYHFPEGNEKSGYVKFNSRQELDAIVADKPHLALLVTFLRLFKLEQDNLNTLSEKHLEYYYHNVLGFSRRAGSPGSVTVLASLVKNVRNAVVPAGTRFSAGKDASGREIMYKTPVDVALVAGSVDTVTRMTPDSAEYGILTGSDALSGLSGRIRLTFSSLPRYSRVYVTSSDGWKQVLASASGGKQDIVLDSGIIAPYSEKVHGFEAGMECPVIKIAVSSPENLPSGSDSFRSFVISQESGGGSGDGPVDYSGVLSGIKASVDSLSGNMDAAASKQLAKYISDLSAAIEKSAVVSSAGSGVVNVNDASVLFFSPTGVLDTRDVISDEIREFTLPSVLLGVSSVSAGDTISLHFRMDQTMCDITAPDPDEPPCWYYLAGKKWKVLPPSAVLSDRTAGMTGSGIITFRIPEDASRQKGILNGGDIWLRLLYPDSGMYPYPEEININAVELWYDSSSEGEPLTGIGVPANTVLKPEYAVSGVKSFTQPYPGEKGETAEGRDSYMCRVSERLRHKDRAVCSWDYERIILESHPNVAAVKCVPCTGTDGRFVPGGISIVLVPDTAAIPQKNPLRPQVDLSTVKSVEETVRSRCSPFVSYSVINPKYQAVKVCCTLKLQNGCADTSYAVERIREKLVEFLSPWNGADPHSGFDHNHNTSKIVHLIETMDEYVDYILDVQIYLDGIIQSGDIIPADEAAVLTSVPASEHIIKTVTDSR